MIIARKKLIAFGKFYRSFRDLCRTEKFCMLVTGGVHSKYYEILISQHNTTKELLHLMRYVLYIPSNVRFVDVAHFRTTENQRTDYNLWID